MKSIEDKIREACFDLSTSLMWEKDNLTVERIESNMTELNEMTEKFLETAKFYLENIEALEGQSEIIVRAINYIEEAHAIPPLRGNYQWFDYTLGALTELACPNSGLSNNNLEFLKDVENGIKDYRENSIDEDEL
tara:strand:- start:310 stop:714 length:405 start_codon:yes stop_codon:yes gene_type:complete